MSIHVTFVNPVMDLIEDYVDYALEVLGFFTAGGVPSLEDLTPAPQAVQRAKDYISSLWHQGTEKSWKPWQTH